VPAAPGVHLGLAPSAAHVRLGHVDPADVTGAELTGFVQKAKSVAMFVAQVPPGLQIGTVRLAV
jgi:hypothetical protein